MDFQGFDVQIANFHKAQSPADLTNFNRKNKVIDNQKK